jgi:hypothetical protein
MKHLLKFNEDFNNVKPGSWFDEIDPVFNFARDEDFEVGLKNFNSYMRVIIYPREGQTDAFKKATKEILYRLANMVDNLEGRIGFDIFHTKEQKVGTNTKYYTIEKLLEIIDNLDQDQHDQGRYIKNDCCFVLWIENPNGFE